MNNKSVSKPVNSTDLKNLSNKMKKSFLDNRINYDTLHQQYNKNLVAKNCTKTQSEITAKLLDPKLLGAFLHSVNSSFKSKKEGRATAVT